MSSSTLSEQATGSCAGFTGLMLADCSCQERATAAGLTTLAKKYVAWLSTTANDMTCRLTSTTSPLVSCALPSGGPAWYNTNNEQIAAGYSDLLDGNLNAAIAYDESRNPVLSGTVAYTGTTQSGTQSGSTCSDWLSAGPAGTIGTIGNTDFTWTAANTSGSCTTAGRTYCIGIP